jgi:hypothetical protein
MKHTCEIAMATLCNVCSALVPDLYSDAACFSCSKTKEARQDRRKAKAEYRGLRAAQYYAARAAGTDPGRL